MSKIGKNLNNQTILSQPRITEKATVLTEGKYPVYTFVIDRSANKTEIKREVTRLYKVVPTRINIINLPAKKITRKGKVGTRAAVKKAMVFLKAGEKIES